MAEETPRRRELLVSRGWVQASIVVFLLGFFVLGLLAYRTYSADPPIPERVVGPEGQTLFTGEDIKQGQKVFLNNGLMEYGSVFGHGAYLGPDYTADYLHRAALAVEEHQGARAPTGRARRRSPISRGTATTRRPTRSPTPRARHSPSTSSSATTPSTSAIRPRSSACSPTRSTVPSRFTS